MKELIFDSVLTDWGASKTCQVLMGTIIFAGIGAMICINLIPNNPKVIEKEIVE